MNTKIAVIAIFHDVLERSTSRSATLTPAKARIGVVSDRKSTAPIASTKPLQPRQPASETSETHPSTGKSRTMGRRLSVMRSPITRPSSENSHSVASPPRVRAVIGVDSGSTHSFICWVNSTSITESSSTPMNVA